MTTQAQHAETFRALHVPGRPLVLINAWDAGSARAVAAGGAAAIATGSWSVAAAHGYPDGEQLPLELALANLARIVAAVDLPVSVDLESGYGTDAASVGSTVAAAIAAGAVGCNLEDSYPSDGKMRPLAEQVQRLAAARRAVGDHGFFINARTDVFFQKPADAHDEAMLAQALERAQAYAAAGADGLFVPGLADETLIARLVRQAPLPVNVMIGAASPAVARLAELGVARVSHGPGPYLAMVAQLEAAARAASAA